MIYITGDTHGSFERIENFCHRMKTTKSDILIILGDAGINYFGFEYDRKIKAYLQSLPITLFSIHGNHEQRPQNICTYKEKDFHEGKVYYEEDYPNLLFGKDGEIYNFNGLKTIVIGGAYSIDKLRRLIHGYGWWEDEQPTDEIKTYVESKLETVHWNIDIVLSHTTPLKYEPIEAFLPGVNQDKVDKSTETWLDQLEDKLQYKKWYCGHYHIEKEIDKIQFMFNHFDLFYK